MLGDGDGRFLQVFTALYPEAEVDAVDISQKMIDLARARVPTANFHLSDARNFPAGDYDLAVAHFFFDCLDPKDLTALLTRIRPQQWLISEFQYTKWSRPLVRSLYFFFRLTTGLRVTTLPDHVRVLAAQGYRREKQQSALSGLLTSELWSQAKATGAGHPLGSKFRKTRC